jgi:hypothetical protein
MPACQAGRREAALTPCKDENEEFVLGIAEHPVRGKELGKTDCKRWLEHGADFAQKWTLTWENVSTASSTVMSTQTDTGQITGPPCVGTTAPCNPQYTEPHEFAVYQDNLYGTFMFWPNSYFSISQVAPATSTVAAGGTASYAISTLASAEYSGTSVSISVTGLPTGANYKSIAGAPGNTLTISISTASSTPPGSYSLTFTVTDGSLSYFAYANLVVTSAASTPSLSSLSPNSATAGGPAFSVTANGSGFLVGSTVEWNGSALTTSYVSGSQLMASVPANLIALPGSATVTVVNPGGVASNPLTFTINPATPSLSNLAPNSATAGGPAFSVTANGSGFLVGSTVGWNGSALTTSYVSGSQLMASVPANFITAQGTASVTVMNPVGGTSNSLKFTITPATPILSSLAPSSAPVGGPAFSLCVMSTALAS